MRNKIVKWIVVASIAVAAACTAWCGEASSVSLAASIIVVPVFSERRVQIKQPRSLLSRRITATDRTVNIISFGSGFLYDHEAFNTLVTAAHVVEFPPELRSVTDADGVTFSTGEAGTTLDRLPARIRISGLAFRPRRMLVDHKLDIAIIDLCDQTVASFDFRMLKPAVPKVDEEAKIWGFPGIPGPEIDGVREAAAPSASQTSQRCDVTDVRRGEVICTALNGIETRGGFSGGPLIDREGRVLGMISRSTPETTRCRSIEAIDGVIARFEAEAIAYSESSKAC